MAECCHAAENVCSHYFLFLLLLIFLIGGGIGCSVGCVAKANFSPSIASSKDESIASSRFSPVPLLCIAEIKKRIKK